MYIFHIRPTQLLGKHLFVLKRLCYLSAVLKTTTRDTFSIIIIIKHFHYKTNDIISEQPTKRTCNADREVTEGLIVLLNRGPLKKQMKSLLCNSFVVFLLS